MGDEERLALQALATSPGYNVLMDLMETQCILQDAAVMSVPVEEEKKIVAEQRVAVAKWEFFASLKKQIEFELGELKGEAQQGAAGDGEEERHILSPI